MSTVQLKHINCRAVFGVLIAYQITPFIVAGFVTVIVVGWVGAERDLTFNAAFQATDYFLIPLRALLGGVASVFLTVWLTYCYAGYRPSFSPTQKWTRFRKNVENFNGLFVGLSLGVFFLVLVHLIPESMQRDALPSANVFRHNYFAVGVYLFNGILLQPLTEEYIFRGFIFSIFIHRFGTITSILMVSALFIFMHAPAVYFKPYGLVGIVCFAFLSIYYRIRSGGLLPSMGMHIGYNAVLILSDAIANR